MKDIIILGWIATVLMEQIFQSFLHNMLYFTLQKILRVVLAKDREQKPICTVDLYHEDVGLHADQVGGLVQNKKLDNYGGNRRELFTM